MAQESWIHALTTFTRIGKNAVVSNSAVMDRVIIGEHAEVHDSIIGRHVVVNSSQHRPTKITAVSVIADDVKLEEGCSLSIKNLSAPNHQRRIPKPNNNSKLKRTAYQC